MKQFVVATLLFLPVLLASCTDQNTYPITGEECAPGDPVQALDAADCVPPPVL